MLLKMGSLTVRKPVERVYAFMCRLENLPKQTPNNVFDEFNVRYKRYGKKLLGEMQVRDIISQYAISKYQGRDVFCDWEVVSLVKNTKIEMQLLSMGRYDDQRGKRKALSPKGSFFENMSIVLLFSSTGLDTQINVIGMFNSRYKILNWGMRFFNFLSRRKTKKNNDEWAKLIEKYS